MIQLNGYQDGCLSLIRDGRQILITPDEYRQHLPNPEGWLKHRVGGKPPSRAVRMLDALIFYSSPESLRYRSMPVIDVDGKKWRLASIGMQIGTDTHCQLVSTSEFHHYRDKVIPVQKTAWVSAATIRGFIK